LRSAAVLLAAAALMSCSMAPTPAPSPSIAPPTQAAELRTQIDLLLTEHVMAVGKESAAALNGSAEYSAYATLLNTNEAALTLLVRRAVGNTTGDGFSTAWRAVNADLVAYAIHVATHDADKAGADTSRLTAITAPVLADQLAAMTLGDPQSLRAAVTEEMTALRDAIDGAANHHYTAMYASLGNAVNRAMALGDVLTDGIVRRFADVYPGEHRSDEVTRRVRLNVFLQQRAYLQTMATEAQLNNRPAERIEATHALASNLDFIVGDARDVRLRNLLAGEVTSLQAYAGAGDAKSKQALSETFANGMTSLTKASSPVVSDQVGATIKVIDDQRAKNTTDVAADDRAAATATQPVADLLLNVP
jgi:hypothetical protein